MAAMRTMPYGIRPPLLYGNSYSDAAWRPCGSSSPTHFVPRGGARRILIAPTPLVRNWRWRARAQCLDDKRISRRAWRFFGETSRRWIPFPPHPADAGGGIGDVGKCDRDPYRRGDSLPDTGSLGDVYPSNYP